MLASDIKIVQTTEQRTYGADLQATVYIRVEFLVGRNGPFVEKFEKDGYTALQRDDRLNTFAAEVRA
jgi:hypothetical protein